jgi:DNA (cytosine-5)-methyltransferase 1
MTAAPPLPTHSETLHELALFAGAGGGILGGHLLGWRTVCAVERDPYAAAVLAQRQNDGALYPFPIWDDVCTFDGRPWRGRVDVISGGFPCQDISVAGRGAGLSGERSGLWREFARIIREVVPRYVFVENSPALAFRGLDVVLSDLAAMGYDAEWGVFGADDVGAPHKRERMWIVAQLSDALRYRHGQPIQHVPARGSAAAPDARSNGQVQPLADADRLRQQQPQGGESGERGRVGHGGQGSDVADAGHLRRRDRAESDEAESAPLARCGEVADAERPRLERHVDHGQLERPADRERSSQPAAHRSCSNVPYPKCLRPSGSWPYWFSCDPAEDSEGETDNAFRERVGHIWGLKSSVGRVANGVAHRMDRLQSIGNGQVPLVAAVAWTELHRRLNT